MKKILILLFLFGIFSFVNVHAATCQGDELTRLKELADNIKVNYEIIVDSSGVELVKMSIYNLSKDLYLIQTNDKDSEKVTINYSDSGKYVFYSSNRTEYITYTFDVYSNVNACSTTLVKTFTFKKPKLNPNWKYLVCSENPTIPACQKYITEDTGVDETRIQEYVESYLAGQVSVITTPTNPGAKGNFFKDNLTYILIGGGAIVLIVGAYIFISKKRSAL